MPRNRYTSLVRDRERAQLTHQEKQLAWLIRQLHHGIPESPAALPLVDAKERRSARLAQNHMNKPNRRLNDQSRGLRTPRDR